MAKVRILVSIAGGAEPKYGLPEFSFRPGEIVTLDDVLAEHWIAAGHAEPAKKKAGATEVSMETATSVQEGA